MHDFVIMGCSIRFAVDLVVCSALGVDMYDCVFPTRTAVSFFNDKINFLPTYGLYGKAAQSHDLCV